MNVHDVSIYLLLNRILTAFLRLNAENIITHNVIIVTKNYVSHNKSNNTNDNDIYIGNSFMT